MDFSQAIRGTSNMTLTTNGQVAFKSTGSKVLDLFATAGALRERSTLDVKAKITAAFQENPLLTLKLAFYTRDIRGGLGERKVGRYMLTHLAMIAPDTMIKNIAYIPEFGRWDDLYALVGTPCEKHVVELIRAQLDEDLANMRANKPISIMAKWLKSINATSKDTQALGRWTATSLGFSERSYRLTLSSLRAYLDVLERKMSKKEWMEIAYAKVPSLAMKRYRDAFKRNGGDPFQRYLDNVKKGVEKINASTLFPYDLTETYLQYWGGPSEADPVIEAQWKALPNYVEPGSNVLVMADTSGSMSGRPLATSVGLAVYFAERNLGAYHNLFMTFSSKPAFIQLKGETLFDKVQNASRADWQQNTNLEAAFKEILRLAVQNKVPASEMPKSLVIISDMEIDRCQEDRDFMGFYKAMSNLFASKGYVIPNLIFWNVNSVKDTFLVDGNREGIQLVSGQSAATFKHLMTLVGLTPYEAMLKVLLSDRYSMITE